jgi:hypothetical protein
MLDGALNPTRWSFRAAFLLAIAADTVQIIAFSLFAEGAVSPLDSGLDVVVAIALTYLLGWHWEFAPSFLAELIPGVDLVPFWTLAVVNVYRKSKQPGNAGKTIDIAPLT